MASYTGTFETGVDTATILASDAGSATAWSDVGGGPVYSATQKYETLSCKSVTTTGSDGGYVEWGATVIGATLTTHYGRIYMFLPNTSACYIIYAFDNAAALAWRLLLNGTFSIRDATGTDVATGAITPPTGQWIRLEWKIISSDTVGLAEFKLFTDADSTSPDETITSGNCDTNTETAYFRFGTPALSPASSTYYFDNILVNDTGYPGPASGASPAQISYPTVDSADGSWTDQGGGSSLYAAIDETTVSDADYIRSNVGPQNSGCRVKLGSPSQPPAVDTGHIVRWRVAKDLTGGDAIAMTVTLRQGGADSLGAGTQIATFNRNGVSSSFTTYEETLSEAEAATITDYTDLYLEFYADGP